MRIRRLICMILAASLIPVAACGKSAETAAPQDAVTSESGQESAPEETEDNQITEEKKSYEPGVWEENVYKNASLGMMFALPEGWEKGTEEELNEIQSQGAQITGSSDEEIQEDSEQTTHEFYIKNPADGSQIVMLTEDAKIYGDISAKEYIQALVAQFKSYEDKGLYYDVSEEEDLLLGETHFLSVFASVEYEGTSLYQQYAVAKESGRLVTLIVTAGSAESEEACKSFLSSIQILS